MVGISSFTLQLPGGLKLLLARHLCLKTLLLQQMKNQRQPRYPSGYFSPPVLNKPKWVASCFIYPSTTHCIFSELWLLVSSCPQDPAAPPTVQDAGGMSGGSAGAEVALTAEGISLPADQQRVLARSVTTLLLLTASWTLRTTHPGKKRPCSSMTLQLSSFSCQFSAARN